MREKKIWEVVVEENGGEYTGWVKFKALSGIKTGQKTLLVDGIEIEFDEEVYDPKIHVVTTMDPNDEEKDRLMSIEELALKLVQECDYSLDTGCSECKHFKICGENFPLKPIVFSEFIDVDTRVNKMVESAKEKKKNGL